MYVCIYRMVEEWVPVCLLASPPWTLGPSGAPSPSPLLSSGSPRPRTQGRRPQPRYRRLLVAFAVLPSPLSITRALLALSFRREGAPVSHKLPLCVPVREPFRRVTYYTHTHAARFERGRIDFKERRERERERETEERRDSPCTRLQWLLQWSVLASLVHALCPFRSMSKRHNITQHPSLRARFSCLDSTSFLGRGSTRVVATIAKFMEDDGSLSRDPLPGTQLRAPAGVFVCSLTRNGDCHLRFSRPPVFPLNSTCLPCPLGRQSLRQNESASESIRDPPRENIIALQPVLSILGSNETSGLGDRRVDHNRWFLSVFLFQSLAWSRAYREPARKFVYTLNDRTCRGPRVENPIPLSLRAADVGRIAPFRTEGRRTENITRVHESRNSSG